MKKKVHTLKSADGSRYLTIDEASKALTIKPTALRNYLCDGKLTTYKFKTLTLLDLEEVRAWKEKRRSR